MNISESEYEIMKVVWEHYPISTNEITEKVLADSNWNVRTVHTLISRLAKKGVLSYTQQGREYIYTPNIRKEDYILSESKSFLKKFYDGAVNKLVLNFLEDNSMTKEDIEELKSILDNKNEH
jgi:BlaI family penicillinase repressor